MIEVATAPDERCRLIAQQTLEALKAARSDGPPPYWNRTVYYKGLPRCRGVIEVKGKGPTVTYLLTGHLRDKAFAENEGHVAAAT